MIGEIREATDRKATWQRAEDVVKQLNQKLAGWANYPPDVRHPGTDLRSALATDQLISIQLLHRSPI